MSRLHGCEPEEGLLKFMPVMRKAQKFYKKIPLEKNSDACKWGDLA